MYHDLSSSTLSQSNDGDSDANSIRGAFFPGHGCSTRGVVIGSAWEWCGKTSPKIKLDLEG